MDIKKRFGNKIRKIRLEKELSQESLAHIADIDRTYMSSIERGERNVSISTIEKLAIAFKVSVEFLMKGL